MISISVVDRNTGSQISLNNDQFSLNGSKIVVLKTDRDNIQSITQNGEQLTIKLKSGETIVINDFFALHDENKNELVIDDQTKEGAGYWWVEEPATGSDWVQLDTLDPLMIQETSDGLSPWMYWVGAGALAIGGLAAASSGGSGSNDYPFLINNTPSDPKVNTNNANGITGTGTPGSEIVLTKPDGTTEVAVTDSNGNWSFTNNGNPLNDGEEGKFVARDPNDQNNTSNEVISVADTQAPDAPIIESNNAAGITGKAEGNSTITLTKPDGSTVTTVADAEGNWSLPAGSLTDGQEGQFTATDKAGNTGEVTKDTADAVAPDAPTIDNVYDDVNLDIGNISNNGYTNDKQPTITGTAELGSTVTIYYTDPTTGQDVVLGKVIAADGSWSFTPDVELPADGSYIFKATATDEAGNTGDFSNDYNINLDTSLPDDTNLILIDSISEDTGIYADDYVTNDQTLIFNGSFTNSLKPNEEVRISLDGGVTWSTATILDGNKWTYDNTANVLPEGSYEVVVRITTKAGGYDANSPMAEQPITIDITGPDEAGLDSTFTISTDTTAGLAAGDDYSHSQEWTNEDLVTRDTTVTISGKLTQQIGGDSYLQISDDNGVTWQNVSLGSDGLSWSLALPEFTQSESRDYQLRVVDKAGNQAIGTEFNDHYTVVVDLDSPDAVTMAPQIPVNANENTVVTFNDTTYGKLEAGTIVSLVNDANKDGRYQEGIDTIIAFTTVNADGTWSFDANIPAGSNHLGFVVWDQAGNHSGLSSVTTDTVTEGDGIGYEETILNWGGTYNGSYGSVTSAASLNANGNWSFFQNNAYGQWETGSVYDMNDTVNTANGQVDFDMSTLSKPSTLPNGNTGYHNYVSSATFADVDRNGYMDVMGVSSSYSGDYQPVWMQNADGTWTGSRVDYNTNDHFGGMVAFDREGDGYVDFVTGDSAADSITFIYNNQGALTGTR